MICYQIPTNQHNDYSLRHDEGSNPCGYTVDIVETLYYQLINANKKDHDNNNDDDVDDDDDGGGGDDDEDDDVECEKFDLQGEYKFVT